MTGYTDSDAVLAPKTAFPGRRIPRAAALHDLSCFGRCALTVVIPTLSAAGIQCVPVPTALLSTHTGGFTGMYFEDLEPAIDAIGAHLSGVGVDFDAVYTGFLGSSRQVRTVEAFIDRFSSPRPLIFVDPVMGDDGVMYSACFPELVGEMKRLCARADVITPNLTEACLLTGTAYRDTSALTREEAEKTARDLSDKLSRIAGPETVIVITGIDCRGAVGTLSPGGIHWEKIRARSYPGTGDLFASVLLAALLRRGLNSADEAAAFASEYTAAVMDYTVKYASDEPSRSGVLLEGCLGTLAAALAPEGGDIRG